MSLDHGMLNVPLHKRADTLFGLSRAQFEAQQRAAESAKRKLAADARVEARRLIGLVSEARWAELGKPHGLSAKETCAQFRSIAVSYPERVAKVMAREIGA